MPQPREEIMKFVRMAAAIALLNIGMVSQGFGQTSQHHHVVLTPDQLKWNDLPALPGVKIAVIQGPLTEAVPIMFRLKFPANYKVPPHRHPGIEHITIISGTLNLGMGESFDKSKTDALMAGSVAIMPPGTAHFVWTSEETIGQVHSIGPWGVTYVNPAEDPRKQ
jgi:quercetin dioxygenase-like cupin family protein